MLITETEELWKGDRLEKLSFREHYRLAVGVLVLMLRVASLLLLYLDMLSIDILCKANLCLGLCYINCESPCFIIVILSFPK